MWFLRTTFIPTVILYLISIYHLSSINPITTDILFPTNTTNSDVTALPLRRAHQRPSTHYLKSSLSRLISRSALSRYTRFYIFSSKCQCVKWARAFVIVNGAIWSQRYEVKGVVHFTGRWVPGRTGEKDTESRLKLFSTGVYVGRKASQELM